MGAFAILQATSLRQVVELTRPSSAFMETSGTSSARCGHSTGRSHASTPGRRFSSGSPHNVWARWRVRTVGCHRGQAMDTDDATQLADQWMQLFLTNQHRILSHRFRVHRMELAADATDAD